MFFGAFPFNIRKAPKTSLIKESVVPLTGYHPEIGVTDSAEV